MTTPTLSVIMGNYNHAHYLVESIPAILNQSFRPKEFIIIDDASTDNSVEVIEAFAKKDPVVRFYKNDINLGNAPTYIKALEKVTGDYFLVAAADDLVFPGLFEKSIEMLEKHPQAGLCSAISKRVDENGDELVTAPEPPYISKTPCYLSPDKVLRLSLDAEAWCIIQTGIWRKTTFVEAGGFPVEAGEFADGFTIPLVTLNYGACFIPEILGMYRVLPGSLASLTRYDPKAFMDRMTGIINLMNTSYAGKFPVSYVNEFHKQALYQMGAISLHNMETAANECFDNLNKSFQSGNFLYWFVLLGSKFLFKMQKEMLKLVLFVRLRKMNWVLIKRSFFRLKNKLAG
jgi:glycosyltransferase involved in cell wall biosynthesis